MAWYCQHKFYYRGRLVEIHTRYGGYISACVLRGAQLDFNYDTPCNKDTRKMLLLFRRLRKTERIRCVFHCI